MTFAKFFPALALSGVLLSSGCASIQTSRALVGVRVDDGKVPVATVAAENYGYYLFGFIPLITGNPDTPEAYDCYWFSDTVTLQNNMRMITEVARRERGTGLANVKTISRFDGAFSLWILCRKIIFTSAVVTRDAPGGPPVSR